MFVLILFNMKYGAEAQEWTCKNPDLNQHQFEH